GRDFQVPLDDERNKAPSLFQREGRGEIFRSPSTMKGTKLPPFSKGRAGEGFPDPSSTMKGTKPPPFSKGRVGERFQTPPQHEKNETPLSLAGEGRGEGVT